MIKQALHQAVKHLVVRIVLHHADLLADDPLLLVHALLGKPGNGHEGEENFQVVAEFLRAFKIVAGEGRAGEGVGEAPLAARSWRALPSSVSNILCSRKWATPPECPATGHPAGTSYPCRRSWWQKGVALLKLGPPVHIDVQAVGQLRVIDFLPRCGGILCLPWAHSLPFRK